MAFMKLVVEAQRKNGPNQAFSWPDMSSMFEEKCKITASPKVLKDKYRNMGRKYEKWCKLINGETGLGWDSVKRTILAPAEWWDKKIQVPYICNVYTRQFSLFQTMVSVIWLWFFWVWSGGQRSEGIQKRRDTPRNGGSPGRHLRGVESFRRLLSY